MDRWSVGPIVRSVSAALVAVSAVLSTVSGVEVSAAPTLPELPTSDEVTLETLVAPGARFVVFSSNGVWYRRDTSTGADTRLEGNLPRFQAFFASGPIVLGTLGSRAGYWNSAGSFTTYSAEPVLQGPIASADGRTVVFSAADPVVGNVGWLRVWTADTGTVRTFPQMQRGTLSGVDPGGRYVYFFDWTRGKRVIDLATGDDTLFGESIGRDLMRPEDASIGSGRYFAYMVESLSSSGFSARQGVFDVATGAQTLLPSPFDSLSYRILGAENGIVVVGTNSGGNVNERLTAIDLASGRTAQLAGTVSATGLPWVRLSRDGRYVSYPSPPSGKGVVERLPLSPPVGAGSTLELQVAGVAGVPSNADAVVLNMTVVNAQAPGFATVYPCGQPRPEASNLNYVAGQTIPNLVIAKPGVGGKVCIYSYATIDVLADVSGFFPAGSGFTPISNPTRVLDTRNGIGI
jgi:hypothetical protein